MPEPIKYEKGKDKDFVAQKPGAPTARFTKLIKVPVKFLMTIPGLRSEHEVLHPKMERVRNLIPLVKDLKWQREHPISIEVHHNGSMFIEDGNHRKLASSLAHLDDYLCKVTFYGGSEDEIDFNKAMQKFAATEAYMNIKKLVAEATAKIKSGEDISSLTGAILKLADEQGIGGATDLDGSPGDQEYDNMRETGEDLAGENDPNKGDARRTGPRPPNDMMQEAAIEPFHINDEDVKPGDTQPTKFAPIKTRIHENLDEETGKYGPEEIQNSHTVNPEAPLHEQVNESTSQYLGQPPHIKITEPRFSDKSESDLGIGADRYRKPEQNMHLFNSKKSLNNGKVASSNKPCATCGMPTDQCACMDGQMPTEGNNKPKTMSKVDPRMDAYKQAEINLKNAMIAHGKMSRQASHMEEIEIPFSDLKLEAGVDYNMSGPGAHQQVTMLVQRYLKAHVYPGRANSFSIARLEQSENKLFVKILVFDNQINHEGSDATKSDTLHKVSNVESKNLKKTAWKKRLTETLGANDKTGLVSCPLESHFLTRSCAICPLAGNPETYIEDGAVECNFDNMNLSNTRRDHSNDIREHRPYQR